MDIKEGQTQTPSTRFNPELGCRIVTEEWECYGFSIERGFKTDGVSFIIKDDRADAAGVLHDWLIANRKKYGMSLAQCRDLFYRKLKEDGVPLWRRSMYQFLLAIYDNLPKGFQIWLRFSFLKS